MDTDGAAPSRTTLVLLGALLAALMLLRDPASLLHPQFWAEDGTLFFQQAFNRGFFATALEPASGYLHTFPRLVAGLSLLLPLELAPLAFNLAAFAVQLVPALYLLSPRMSRHLPTPSGRVLAAVLYVALPASAETHANLTNSHWHLTLIALCILVAERAASPRVRALETAALALFSVTGPFPVLFLPLLAPRLLRLLRREAPIRAELAALIIAAGAALQLGFALTSARVGAAAPSAPLSFREVLTIVSSHAFFNAIFGANGFTRFYRALPLPAFALGLALLALLLYAAARDRVAPLLILFYLAALSIALSLLFPLNDLRYWLHPQAGPRYFLFACVFVLFASLHLAAAAGPARPVGYALLAVMIGIGIPADFFHPRQPDVRWGDNVAVLRSLPAGSDFFVPVIPLYHGGMVLHQGSARRGPPPLSRFEPVAEATPADFSVSRPPQVGLAGAANDRYLGVGGWAIDGAARAPAGGVLVLVDDRVFPAVFGLPSAVDVGGRTYERAGFFRLIPVAEIGPGAHRVSVVALSADGRRSYRPAPPRTFATGDFFP
jgi:hypothetical protein